MKERLIELLKDSEIAYAQYLSEKCDKAIKGDITEQLSKRLEFYADYLLENGVIVPPCKVGDKVYRIVKMSTGVTNKHKVLYKDGKITGIITPCEPTIKYFIRCVEVTKNNFFDVCENFGKTVFSTKEEAQKALGGVEE